MDILLSGSSQSFEDEIIIPPSCKTRFTDASVIAIGATLIQRNDEGQPVIVLYLSRKLKESEIKYPTIDLKALAVVEAVRAFDPYVCGHTF